jgi:hypothetical protein
MMESNVGLGGQWCPVDRSGSRKPATSVCVNEVCTCQRKLQASSSSVEGRFRCASSPCPGKSRSSGFIARHPCCRIPRRGRQRSTRHHRQYDPNSHVSVLPRRLIDKLGKRTVVACLVHKHHCDLERGGCLEASERSVTAYPVSVSNRMIAVAA